MITHIHTVAVFVEDQNKTINFWMKKMGFVIRKNILMGNNVHLLEMGPEGGQTCLVLYPRSIMPKWNEYKASIVFQCSNVEEEVQRLKAQGVEIIGEVKKSTGGTFAKFKDIDGNEFLLKSD